MLLKKKEDTEDTLSYNLRWSFYFWTALLIVGSVIVTLILIWNQDNTSNAACPLSFKTIENDTTSTTKEFFNGCGASLIMQGNTETTTTFTTEGLKFLSTADEARDYIGAGSISTFWQNVYDKSPTRSFRILGTGSVVVTLQYSDAEPTNTPTNGLLAMPFNVTIASPNIIDFRVTTHSYAELPIIVTGLEMVL